MAGPSGPLAGAGDRAGCRPSRIEPRRRGRFLGQELAELPEPHQRRDRVVEDVPLRRHRRLEHRRAASLQESEVWRGGGEILRDVLGHSGSISKK